MHLRHCELKVRKVVGGASVFGVHLAAARRSSMVKWRLRSSEGSQGIDSVHPYEEAGQEEEAAAHEGHEEHPQAHHEVPSETFL